MWCAPEDEFLHSPAAGAAHCLPITGERTEQIHLPPRGFAMRRFVKLLWTIVVVVIIIIIIIFFYPRYQGSRGIWKKNYYYYYYYYYFFFTLGTY